MPHGAPSTFAVKVDFWFRCLTYVVLVSSTFAVQVDVWGVDPQMHSLGHSCTGNCICEEEIEREDWEIDQECPVSGHEFCKP